MKLNTIDPSILFEGYVEEAVGPIKALWRKWINKLNVRSFKTAIRSYEDDIAKIKKQLQSRPHSPSEVKKQKELIGYLTQLARLNKQVLVIMEKRQRENTWKKDDPQVWKIITKIDSVHEMLNKRYGYNG